MWRLFVPLALLLPVLLGCQPQDEVRVLQVPKEAKFTMPASARSASSAKEQSLEARMLAGIVPRDQLVWFFKMVGTTDDIRAQRGEFRRLLESLSFDEQDEPQWELPDGWREQPGSGMRKATLKAGASPRAPSVTVIGLAAPQEVLSNVNRWREQLQQPPLAEDELADYVDTFEVAGAQVTLADIIGTVDPQAAMGRPMPPATANRTSTEPEFTYNIPSAWSSNPASGMRKASFAVSEGDRQAEITVISLPPAAAELLPNVNRWREQLGLEPLDESSVEDAARTVQISGREGQYVERMSQSFDDGMATVAAMVPRGELIWFFKLTGDATLVASEEANFEKFLESVEFVE